MRRLVLLIVLIGLLGKQVGAGKIDYQPISAETRKLGRLAKYSQITKKNVRITLGDLTLEAGVPEACDAYDAVPIEYELTGDAGDNDCVAVEAVAFEDVSRRKGRDLYDLAMPGNMKLKIEYLGSQTGIFEPQRVNRLTLTSRHEIFPPYRLEPFVRSGTVKQGNYLFFKFRITNVGDTILDAEGFGGWMAVPDAHTLTADGKRGQRHGTINGKTRHLDYLYPGESFEQWVHFHGRGQDIQHARTLPLGKHEIRYIAEYRYNKEYDWIVNMWAGKPWLSLEFDIDVTEQGGQSEIKTEYVKHENAQEDRMTRYVRSLEEFMTSFRVFERNELGKAKEDTIHVQVAPWTKHIVLKLIGNKPGRIETVAVPVEVNSNNLAVQYNRDNPFVIVEKRRKVPLFVAQMMPAMRSTTQLGPHPEKHLRDRLAEAMDAGLNTVCSTAGDWHLGQIYNPKAFVGDIASETFKHYYDVIVPESGVNVFGWAYFPPKTYNPKGIGEMVLGRKFNITTTSKEYTTYSHRPELDVAHPDWPKLYAAAILFNYGRWGNMWYKTADGDTIIDMEDSWGWLRDDINIRYYLGPHAIQRFHRWLRLKYRRRIDRLNKAWGTSYENFDEIDPQANQGNEGKAYHVDLSHMRPVYNKPDHPFHDWSPAVNDWDVFRTELRMDILAEIQKYLRRDIPRACINVRTEGAVIPVTVPESTDVAHLRHIRYVQRRNALVAEVLQKRKVLKYHSDYTTIPYTESEWRLLLGKLREQGMRGNYLPQFCTMRDMVLNDEYGRDFSRNYNLPEPKRAVMMHVLQAAFPVWRIMYEEGHVPGVLWEDFDCDGFVTETQRKELRIFRDQLDLMLENR